MASILFEEGIDGPKAPKSVHKTKQLLNNIVDGLARTRPQTLYGEIPVSPITYDAGYRKVTYRALANAINGVAWWLTKKLGRGKNFQSLCYIGWNDVRYVIMVLGAVKAGYKLLLLSPRNNIEATLNLFDELDCQVLITTDPQPPSVKAILEKASLQTLVVGSVEELLTTEYAHFPFNKTFEQAQDEPLVSLHTSGTTGLPRPVIYTHDWAATYIQTIQLEPPAGFESLVRLYQGTRIFILLPPFHASSMFGPLMEAIANQSVILYPLATTVPSSTSMAEALKYTTADTAVIAPPMVAEIATNSELLEFLSKRIDVILFGGGDLPQAFGDIVTSKFRFYTSNGSTETGPYPLIRPSGEWPKDDWKYNQLHPMAGLEYRLQTDDLYEAVIVRNQKEEEIQPVFKLYPHLQEYRTKDLFSPHPTRPDLWTYRGRADDMINLASGTINPTHMDHAIAAHPKVRDGLMVPVGKYARERFASKTGLLVEVKEAEILSEEDREKFVDEIWALAGEANIKYREEARVLKSHIVIVDPQKPLPRNGKGLVQRGLALENYAAELERLL
ncbi:hypothetical protein G7Y89_g10168 [Cudoniella acicularis]|uniref:AMP-dependent synthetase/ligase domain-containing protein n=1 Tax=Cudoniella acicularis TaxID=354080 RepID=A0A8H4VZG6_9HELO|nr:hypothetical protein G7Y89_g10168 [Cudoniella acicularis]